MEVARTRDARHPLTSPQLTIALRGPLYITGPGRTVYDIYQSLGHFFEQKANKLASRLGLGPLSVLDRIERFMGTEPSHREAKIQELKATVSPKLKKYCFRLLQYTVLSEAACTQIDSFKCLVLLTTRYPGLRVVFLSAPRLGSKACFTRQDLVDTWGRQDAFGVLGDFNSALNFAAECMTERSISGIVEASSQPLWRVDDTETGLTVVERLIIASSCSGTSEYSTRLAIRYLGGILECPSFWLQDGLLFDGIIQKILGTTIALLKDVGIDELKGSYTQSEAAILDELDVEGIDILCHSVIIGIPEHILAHGRNRSSPHCWYPALSEFLFLMRHPRTENILPLSWEGVKDAAIESLVPAHYSLRRVETFTLESPTSSMSDPPSESSPFQRMTNQIIRPRANVTDSEREDAVQVDPSDSAPRKSTSSTSVSFTGAQQKPFLADEFDGDGPHTLRDIDLPSAAEDTPTRAPSQLPRLETDAIHGKAALVDSDVELLPSSPIIAPQKNDNLDQPVIKDVALATSSTSTEPAAAPRFVSRDRRQGSSFSSVGNDGSPEFASEDSTFIAGTSTSMSLGPLKANGRHPSSATPVLRPASPSMAVDLHNGDRDLPDSAPAAVSDFDLDAFEKHFLEDEDEDEDEYAYGRPLPRSPRFVPRPGSSSSSVGSDGSSEFASENSTLIPQTLTSISPAPLQVNGQHPTSATPVLRPASPSPAQQEDTREEDTWAPRPPPDDIYKRLEEFFPEHDLDEPVIEAASAPDSNDQIPVPVQRSPAATAKDKGRDKKSIRIVAQEGKKYGDEMTSIQRKRSTKLWASRVEEVDTLNLFESPTSDVSSTVAFKWIRGELIGRGTYGRVYLALNARTGEMIAVKQVETPRTAGDKSDTRQISVVQALKMESETLKDLDHPNIVQYLGFEETPTNLSIFLEYVPGGSIGSCLLKYGKFEEDVTKSFTSQILAGLEYLHSKGVIHRDLKSDNILVEISGVCKISDFGTSKRTDDHNDTHTAMQGTVFWMAPEVVDTNRTRYNTKIDIWSIGCLLLEMWTGARPWSGEEIVDVMIKLYQSKLPPLPDGLVLTQQADDFRGKCFAINPDERSTAAELRDHPYLTPTPGWVFDGFERQRAADMNSKRLKDYHANGSQSLAP